MIQINLHHFENKYEFSELTKIFLKPEDFVVIGDFDDEETKAKISAKLEGKTVERVLDINSSDYKDKNLIKYELYQALAEITGQRADWGIMTGVRPVKLTGELIKKHGLAEADRLLKELYLLSDEKRHLVLDTYDFQQTYLGEPKENSAGIYIGIPFCPTRCLYCSFTSNQVPPNEINRYLTVLYREIEACGSLMKERGYHAESIYMGGGTPTTLSADQMDVLLNRIEKSFGRDTVREFTVEAGRPDTIDYHKLGTLLMHDIDRISINPQSMKAGTLEIIGRAHTPKDTRAAMKLAKKMGMNFVNMDIIAGLPKETPADFKDTLEELIDYGAANITVHTLAVKRASLLIEQDPDFHYKQADTVRTMLEIAKEKLTSAGYRPYYLYRQKHMAGSLENIGWCKDNAFSVYNIRIMEEAQTIAALGAGGISKQFYPAENRHERVPNVSNYDIYIDRIDEMIKRKQLNLFN